MHLSIYRALCNMGEYFKRGCQVAFCDRRRINKHLRAGAVDSANLLIRINNNDLISFLNEVKAGSGDLIRARANSKLIRLETLKGIIYIESSGEDSVTEQVFLSRVLVAERLIREIRQMNRGLAVIMKEVARG